MPGSNQNRKAFSGVASTNWHKHGRNVEMAKGITLQNKFSYNFFQNKRVFLKSLPATYAYTSNYYQNSYMFEFTTHYPLIKYFERMESSIKLSIPRST